MVVCATQSFTTDQELNGCSTMKSTQTTQIQHAEMVDNGNGAEEDREEGEIVDDFEMIISSEDDEFKLRARIQQLEDKSKELEKVDMVSANLANPYSFQRSQRVERFTQYQHFSPICILSDVSSLSEEEYDRHKKTRKHRLKRLESRRHVQMTRRNPFSNRTQTLSHVRRKRRHEHHNNKPQATILVDSLDSVTEDEVCEYDLNGENEDNEYMERLELNRNKLRKALARSGNYDIKPKHTLKERLQYRMRKSPSPTRNHAEHQRKTQEVLPPHSFEGYSQHCSVRKDEKDQQLEVEEPAELKLRLIALKSAMLKKHMARKKRDAERAYSPTDMIHRVHQPNVSNDIDDLMEISPAASPERTAYSPPAAQHFGEPVDMDLVQTDSDEERQPWPHNCQSAVNSGGSWHCFMPNSLPPVSMPIVIDDDDEEELQPEQRKAEKVGGEDDKTTPPPPPPPFYIPHVQLEDDDARDALHLSDRSSHQDSLSDIQSISMENSQSQTQESRSFLPESSDDEAAALRAMLLSTLKPAADVKTDQMSPLASVKAKAFAHDSDDPEELRQLLLSSIASKKKTSPVKVTPESPKILKNAVRRFQSSSLQSNVPSQPIKTQLDVTTVPIVSPANQLQQAVLPVPLPAPLAKPVPLALPVPLEVPPPVSSPKLPVEAEVVTAPGAQSPTPSTNIIKIVKPNKVINKKTVPKRKISKLTEPIATVKRPSMQMVKEPMALLHNQNSINTTRLITKIDPSRLKVNKLVIALADSSAGSDDELQLGSCYAYSSCASYADNATPLSQAMDSASSSTTRSNTPNSEILEATASSNPNLRRTVINEYFEKKLDDFLKQARSKAPTALPLDGPKPTPEAEKLSDQIIKATEPPAVIIQRAKSTPVAVRHLPVESQKEYLRLIERMQLLEKKKIGVVKSLNGQSTSAAKGSAKAVPATSRDTLVASALTDKTKAAGNSAVGAVSPRNTGENRVKATKNVAVRTGIQSAKVAVSPKATVATDTSNSSDQPRVLTPEATKQIRLKAFESSFLKIGGSMISNLAKSLQMVEEAKISKIAQLRYSHRLKDLYAELQSVKQAYKLEETKLARIQPEIQASHEIIISLKQKRNKLRKAALDLGNGLQGADYRLMDPSQAEITHKSTLLTKEIRVYNSIVKYGDTSVQADVNTCKEVAQPGEEAKSKPQPESEPVPELSVQLRARSNSSGDSQTHSETKLRTEKEMQLEAQAEEQPQEKELEAQTEQQPQEKELEPSNCSATSTAGQEAGEGPVIEETQLEVDNTPRIKAPAASSKPEILKAPPYTGSFMRELCEPPANVSLLGEYRTPLPRNYNSRLNVNATVCPFELMGRCEDSDCTYLHLTSATPSDAATALKQ